MTHRRLDVRLRVLGRRALRAVRRHYVTLGSVAVIGVLFALVMSSDSFVSRDDRALVQPAATPDATRAFFPRGQRRSVVFYLVEDQNQLESIAEAFTADQEARIAFPVDYAVFLLAGTPAQEAEAIARLNFEALAVQGMKVDMRVVDVRRRTP